MVKGLLNPCGSCKTNCGSNSVFCSFCSSWFHAKCEQLSSKDVSVLAKANRGYICSACSDDNYELSLSRITEAAKCYSYMEKVVRRESVIMRRPFVVTDELPTVHVYFQRNIGTVSRKLQEMYGFMPERRPLFVSGDGNCLFNAVSVALCGSQKLAAELRVRTVIEMVLNAEKYTSSANAKTYLTLAPNYKDACVECGKNGAYSSVWTMVALSSVIGRPIHSVYPPCNGTEGSIGFIYRSLNTTFLPNKNCRSQPVYIMWTSTMEHRKGYWSPNHFVPLLALTDVPGIPPEMSVLQTNFSSSSQTYQQEFPDLSSSLEIAQSPKRQKLSTSPDGKNSKFPVHSESSYLGQGEKSTSFLKMNSTPIDTPPEMSVPSSSQTYQQDFPDLSSSLEIAKSPIRQKLSTSPDGKYSKFSVHSESSYLGQGEQELSEDSMLDY